MLPCASRITATGLFVALLTPTAGCAHQRAVRLQEASANFDLEDVEPFLTRLVALIDSGFTLVEVKDVAARIAKQPIDSEREYGYTVVADETRSELRIVVFMDDVEAPDIAFFTDAKLAARIQTAMEQYFEDVGK